MAQQTLVLCTPDAVSRGVTFEISSQFEKRGLTMVACRMLRATTAQAQAHVDCTKAGSVAQLTSGPAVATVWQGAGAIAAGIEIAGAAGGSDLLSVSPSAASATLEIAVWFGADEVPPPDSNGAAAAASGSVAASAPSADGDAAAAGGKSKGQLKKEAAKAAKAAKKAEAKGGTPAGPAISTEPPSGTRDFFPAEMRTRNWLFAKFRETARQLAFVEYDAPVLEAEQLYVRKGGEEITQQMYNFTDKDGKAVSLRPEMTPTLARMILSLGGKVLLPVKWFSIPQCWRFETVQRGRKREHFQWNMDIVGEASIAAEAELLAGVTSFFKSVGVTSADVGIKVNSRKVLAAILKMYGIDDDKFEAVCVIVDKLDKIGPDETVQLLRDAQVSDEAARKIVASLSLRSIGELQELVGEHPVAADAMREMKELFALAEAYGFGDWILFDASVVRGLAYYTGIVFEGFDRKGELRAICGGGRYDKLLSLYGSPTVVPACGFGFGDCVIMELLQEKGLLPHLEPEVDFVVCPFNAEMRLHAVQVAATLRAAGYAVDVLLANKRADKAFSYADRVSGRRMVFVAPDEWDKGSVRVKDLRFERSEEEKLADRGIELPVAELVAELSRIGVAPQREERGA